MIHQLLSGARGRVLAGIASRIWGAILALSIYPLYLHFVGAEALGIIAAYASIQAIITLFDGSLAPSLTRQLVKSRVDNQEWGKSFDLFKTMEIIYWALALIAGLLFAATVPLISNYWLNPEQLAHGELETALLIAAAGLTLQWPSTLYVSGLVGMEKQTLLAGVGTVASTLKVVFTVLALYYLTPSVITIFVIGTLFNMLQTLLMRHLFIGTLPKHPDHKAKYDVDLIKEVWRFSGGLSLITVTSVVLSQADKIAFSKLLDLSDFGYYSIATSIANSLFIVSGAMFSVTFPKLSELILSKQIQGLRNYYHLASQALALLIFPASAVIIFYAEDLLFVWTHNATVATQGATLLPLFIVGNLINCALSVPYTLQLSNGLTKVVFMANMLALCIYFPLINLLFAHYNVISGPISWAIVNAILLAIIAYSSHKNILQGDGLKWLIEDVSLPLTIAIGTVYTVQSLFLNSGHSWQQVIPLMGLAWLASSAALVFVMPEIRNRFIHLIKKKN